MHWRAITNQGSGRGNGKRRMRLNVIEEKTSRLIGCGWEMSKMTPRFLTLVAGCAVVPRQRIQEEDKMECSREA